jgi:TatD DNase family protein
MIDFHCHLDLYPNPQEVVSECIRRDLYVLCVTTTPSAWKGTSELIAGSRRIRIALGLHPELASERKIELDLFDSLLPQTRYVGEVGLDGTPASKKFWTDQTYVFEHVLSACKAIGGRIITIHSRRAVSEVLDRLESFSGAGIPILHWYSGSERDLNRAIQIGCWFSVGPAMLAGEKGRALVARMPRDRVITETDGPFGMLSGRFLYPWDVSQAIASVASVWAVDDRYVDEILNENLRRLSALL